MGCVMISNVLITRMKWLLFKYLCQRIFRNGGLDEDFNKIHSTYTSNNIKTPILVTKTF